MSDSQPSLSRDTPKGLIGRVIESFRIPPAPGVTRFEHFALGGARRGIRIANPQQDGALLKIYRATCAKAGMKPGKLMVVDTLSPNAVYLMNGSMAIHSSLPGIINGEEMEAIVAHELGHGRHRFKHLWAGVAIAGAVTVASIYPIRRLTDYLSPARWEGMDARSWGNFFRKGVMHTADVLKSLLVGLTIGGIYQGMTGRNHELEADARSAQITGNPGALISGLEKVEKRDLEIRYHRLKGNLDYLEAKIDASAATLPPQPETDQAIEREAHRAAAHQAKLAEQTGSHPPNHERAARLRPPASYREQAALPQTTAAVRS